MFFHRGDVGVDARGKTIEIVTRFRGTHGFMTPLSVLVLKGELPAAPLELSSLAANLGEMKVTKLSRLVCRGGKAR